MTRIWRFLLIGLLFGWLTQPSTAHACACSGNWAEADAIFRGTVIGVDSPSMYGLIGAQVANITGVRYSEGIIFSVQEAWQGVERTETTIRNGGVERCGIQFERGQEYLVYASRQADGHLHTGVCTATVALDGADGALAGFSAETTLPLTPVPRITPYEIVVFSIISLLAYWWIFMVRAIRANPLRF